MGRLIEVFVFVTLLFLFGILVSGAYSCTSWVTSGEIGKDVGNFAGEVSKGYNSRLKRVDNL